jgi:translocation and assembly module TamB
LQHADLEPVSHGRITFNASTGLRQWVFTDASPLEVDLDASQLDVQDLVKLSGQQAPVTGTLAAKVHVHGTSLSPIGQGNVSLTHVTAYDQPVTSATLTFAGTGDEVHGDLGVQLPAGNVQSKVSIRPREKSYNAQLTAAGIRLDQLQALKAQKVDATGVVSIKATGQGTFDNPQLDATLQIPQIDVQNQTIKDVNLQMNVANHLATANLSSTAVGTAIRANAKVNLTGDYQADATLDTQAIPLQPIFAIYAPDQAADLTGQTEVHATLHGPLKNKKLLEAHVTIPTLKLAYSNTIQLAETSPIRVDYKDTVITLQRSGLRGTDTDLQFQGSMSTASGAPMSLLLLGTVNLHLAQVFAPDISSSGELKFNINSNGATNSADFGGQVEIVDANFASEDLPVGLQHGNGVLTLTKDRLNITKFQGTVGGGTVTAQGGVAYRPGVQFDLGLAATGVRVLYPQGVRENVNANLRLAGTTDNAVLGGQVNLADLSFTPAFDLNSFIDQFSGSVSPPPTPGLTQNIQLNLGVSSSNNINLVSRTLSVGGSANLRVRGTVAEPVILGRVNLSGGDIILNGTRFVLNGGTIEFVNPSETQPVVNLALNTTIQQYNISMRFNGPIDQLRTNYSSDPSLPAADIINLLAFGETTEASAANATPANQAAESLVASQVSSQVTSRVSKVAGISQLSINPVLAGGTGQGPPGANITIQQRVTGNLFVTFSSNVASTQNQTIQGQYQLSPRVAVSATRDQNGGFGFDTLIKKSW